MPESIETDSYKVSDPYFGQPHIDVDEQREAPYLHRHVHGGFADCDARFTFYFPDRVSGLRQLRVTTCGGLASAAAALPRQAEDPFGDDVPLNFRRPGVDGARPRAFSETCHQALLEAPGSLLLARRRGDAAGLAPSRREPVRPGAPRCRGRAG